MVDIFHYPFPLYRLFFCPANRVWGQSFIKECGLPTKLSRLKSTVEITPEVLRQVADTCNIIKAGPRELSRDEIYEILMECL